MSKIKSIKVMVNEHENIKRMVKVLRTLSYRVLTLTEFDLFDVDDMFKVIEFMKVYADEHHHTKEENILFKTMNKNIEKIDKASDTTSMYIEHEMSRIYIMNLEKALKAYRAGNDKARLDIIANAISYADLVERHIESENTAMYKFAQDMLDDESKSYMETESNKIEDLARESGLQDKYISILESLEKKYR